MRALDFAALGIFGITLTAATIGLSSPQPFLAAGGEVGLPIADALADAPGGPRLAGVRFVGERSGETRGRVGEPVPRAF